MTFESPNDVLEHFGVKGQRWGVVKNKSRSNANRTGKQKAAIAGVGVASYLLGAAFASRMTMGNVPLSVLTGGSTAALGVRAARNIIDQRGDTQIRNTGR